jgi:hypothetical protein
MDELVTFLICATIAWSFMMALCVVLLIVSVLLVMRGICGLWFANRPLGHRGLDILFMLKYDHIPMPLADLAMTLRKGRIWTYFYLKFRLAPFVIEAPKKPGSRYWFTLNPCGKEALRKAFED